MKQITKLFYLLMLSVIAISFSADVYALNDQSTGYQSSPGATTTVNVWSNCKRVTNSSSIKYFIPTKTQAEWDNFLAHLPSGVTVGPCCPADHDSALYCGGDGNVYKDFISYNPSTCAASSAAILVATCSTGCSSGACNLPPPPCAQTSTACANNTVCAWLTGYTDMVGCEGSVTWANAASLCGSGWHVCSQAEFYARNESAGAAPAAFWLSESCTMPPAYGSEARAYVVTGQGNIDCCSDCSWAPGWTVGGGSLPGSAGAMCCSNTAGAGNTGASCGGSTCVNPGTVQSNGTCAGYSNKADGIACVGCVSPPPGGCRCLQGGCGSI